MAKKQRSKKAIKPPAAPVEPAMLATVVEPAPSSPTPTAIVEPYRILYRCIAVTSMTVKKCEFGREFGVGQIVDLEESISDGSKLRTHARLACFVPVEAWEK